MTSSCLCSFRNSLPWFTCLVIPVITTLSSFFGHGLLALLFTSLMILTISTKILISLSKKNPVSAENVVVQNEALISPTKEEEEEEEEEEEVAAYDELHLETEAFIAQNKEEEVEEVNGVDQNIQDYLTIRSSADSSYSENESCIDQSFTTDQDDSDAYSGDAATRSSGLSSSDGSISDEESLIEIALPGHYVHTKQDDTKLCFQQKLSPQEQHIFRQHGLMELFAEFNEEENLIEIDISMGSIKCSRFEIQA